MWDWNMAALYQSVYMLSLCMYGSLVGSGLILSDVAFNRLG